MPDFIAGILLACVGWLLFLVFTDKNITYPASLSSKVVEAEAYCVGNGGIDQKFLGYRPSSGKHSLKWTCKNSTSGEIRWIENEQ